MGRWHFWSATRLCALASLIVTFPPVFAHVDRTDGLKLATSIFLFYFCRGLLRLAIETGTSIAVQNGNKAGGKISSETMLFARRVVECLAIIFETLGFHLYVF